MKKALLSSVALSAALLSATAVQAQAPAATPVFNANITAAEVLLFEAGQPGTEILYPVAV